MFERNILLIEESEKNKLLDWNKVQFIADAIKKFTPSLGIPYLGV